MFGTTVIHKSRWNSKGQSNQKHNFRAINDHIALFWYLHVIVECSNDDISEFKVSRFGTRAPAIFVTEEITHLVDIV